MALLRVQDAHDIMELTTEQLRDAGSLARNVLRLRQATHPHEAAPSAAASMIVRRDITLLLIPREVTFRVPFLPPMTPIGNVVMIN